MENKKTVCVMLSAYNGEDYIGEQIQSILFQKDINVVLYIRDDGSSREFVRFLGDFEGYSNIKIIYGQNLGVAQSFWELLKAVPDYDYYAWSDQDDIWDPDKLCTAVALLEEDNADLYYCANRIVDKAGNPLGKSVYSYTKSTSLKNALIRSDAQGATFVFNNDLRKALSKGSPDFDKLKIYHDAWMHKASLAIGKKVVFDSVPHLSYRVHGNNVVAKEIKKKTIFKKISAYFEMNTPNFYSELAKLLICTYKDQIKPEEKKIVELVAYYRTDFLYKLQLLFTNKVSTYDWKRNLSFKILVLFNKA